MWCNISVLNHNIDGTGELSVIHECLTPLKRSFWDQAGFIKAGVVSYSGGSELYLSLKKKKKKRNTYD